MKYLFLFSLVLPALFFTSCGDDEDQVRTSSLDLQFLAKYQDADLDNSAAYAYPGDMDVRVTLFQFYLSDIELLPADGSDPVHLSDIELIRFRDQFSAAAAASGQVRRYAEVPAGDYSGIRYRLGVRPDLNAQPPSAYAADYVLNENEYWGPAGMYVFAKMEGNVDVDNDGMFQEKFTYHLGRDDLYRTIVYDVPFTISTTEPNQLTFVTDVYDVFTQGADFIDFRSESLIIHGHANNPPRLLYLWENLQNGLLLRRQ